VFEKKVLEIIIGLKGEKTGGGGGKGCGGWGELLIRNLIKFYFYQNIIKVIKLRMYDDSTCDTHREVRNIYKILIGQT
jgi:hypothetical protein